MERRAFNDQPALSDRPIYCILRRRLIDPEAVVRLMQHDRLQGPAIEGGPRDLRGDFGGRELHDIAWPPNAGVGFSVPDVEVASDLRLWLASGRPWGLAPAVLGLPCLGFRGRSSYVERVRVLSLIEEYEGDLRLTPTGRERITHSRIVHSQAGEAAAGLLRRSKGGRYLLGNCILLDPYRKLRVSRDRDEASTRSGVNPRTRPRCFRHDAVRPARRRRRRRRSRWRELPQPERPR